MAVYYFTAKECPFCDNEDDTTSWSDDRERDTEPCRHQFTDIEYGAYCQGLIDMAEQLKENRRVVKKMGRLIDKQ